MPKETDDLFAGIDAPPQAPVDADLFVGVAPETKAEAKAARGADFAKIAKLLLLGSPGRLAYDSKYRDDVRKEILPILEKYALSWDAPAPFTEKPIFPEIAKDIGRAVTTPGRALQGGYNVKPEKEGEWSEVDQFRQNQLDELLMKDALGFAGIAGTGSIPNVLRSGASSIPFLNSGVSRETAELARLARDKYGYPVRPGQMSDNTMVRRLDSMLERLPFSGYRRTGAAQQEAINRGVAAEIGEDATRINSGVWARARRRMQDTYENLFSSESATIDPTFFGNVTRTLEQAERLISREEFRSLQNAVRGILRKVDTRTGEISGRAYQNLRNDKSDLKRLGQSSSNAALYAREIRHELDNLFRRSIPEEKRGLLQRTDRQYAIMKDLRPLVPKAEDAGGNISPQLLAGATRKGEDGIERAAFGLDGNLGELARIGQAFKPMSTSGTAENTMIAQFLSNPLTLGFGAGGAGLGSMLGTVPAIVAGGALGAASTRALGGFMASPRRAENMILRSLGERAAPGQELPHVGAVPFLYGVDVPELPAAGNPVARVDPETGRIFMDMR